MPKGRICKYDSSVHLTQPILQAEKNAVRGENIYETTTLNKPIEGQKEKCAILRTVLNSKAN